MSKFLAICLFLTIFALPQRILATNLSDVTINEIAWMGTTSSANDEWMELKNNMANPIDLTGWSLQSADGKLKINLRGGISGRGFYLLERTDDTTIPSIAADLVYKGILSNSGIDLRLYDNSNNLIDEASYQSGWPAGDNTTKQTMERTDSGWQTSQNPGGTPRAENSLGATTIKIETGNKALPDLKKSGNSNKVEASLAVATSDFSQNIDRNNTRSSNPWSLFFIVLATTIILAISVLFIKLKFLKNHVGT